MVSKIEDKFKSGKNIGEKTLTTKWAAEIKWTEQQKTKLAKSYSASILAFHKTDQMAVIEEYTKKAISLHKHHIPHISNNVLVFDIIITHIYPNKRQQCKFKAKKKEIQKR